MTEDHEPIKFPGLEAAVVGVASQQNGPKFLVYSVEKIIEILEQDMDHDDALEFFEYNVRGVYAGTGTPFLLDPMDAAQAEETLAGEG
tara:strand:+ start:178 stop:441 length:264 start_codon:yes stop_codon:yes gene_type:complete